MLRKVRSLMALLVGAEDMRRLGGPGPMAGNSFHHLQQCEVALVQMLDVLGRQRQAREGRPCAEFVECRWLFRRIHPILPFASMQSTCRVSPWLGPCMNRPSVSRGRRQTVEPRMFKRVRVAAASVGLLAATAMPAFSQGTLRIGMTAADIPQTTGQPDQGFEGFRFAGYTIYDALVNWDLSKADTIADIKPGLATEWSAVEGEPTKWIFKLRQGVKFHDGTDFDADVVVWNLEKVLNDKSPQFDPKQAAQARGRVPTLVGWKV